MRSHKASTSCGVGLMRRLAIGIALMSAVVSGVPRRAVGAGKAAASISRALPADSVDPSLPGPHQVVREDYDFGDAAYLAPSVTTPVEIRASVHYPADLSSGPFPLIVISHGANITCYSESSGSSAFGWPCGSLKPVPNYTGYDYLARRLAT